ncbi:hypothetical protein KR009_002784, partial [Drosophila setifemur]
TIITMSRASKVMMVVPIPKINLIPESEVMDREAKYISRLADVTLSGELIKRANRDFHEMEQQRGDRERWERYLQCDGLPPPHDPVKVRTFIAKMRHFDDIETNNSMSWILSVDERCILNQNIFRVDKTRETTSKTSDDPGKHYEINIQMCLDTLRLMDIILDNDAELERLSNSVQVEIMKVYNEVEEEVNNQFNRLTYRILRLQNSYMNTADNKVTTWSYKSEAWQLDLWGLLNVSILFDQLEVPVMLAELKSTGVEVQMPMSVLTDCLTIRCLHTDFDNISQFAKSFEPAITFSANFPRAGIVDMQESLINEWIMQLDLQDKTMNEMIRRREEYEEVMLLIAERTEQAAREAKQKEGEQSKIVIPRAPKEPPMVAKGMFPDIYSDFLKLEDSEYVGYLDEVYHPRNLDMYPGEINLRDYIMIGGIYAIMFVRRPDQTQFQKFNIILHEDGRVLHTMPDIVADLGRRSTEISRKSREANMGSRIMIEDNALPYFIVTLQLPPGLCKWSEPVVCQYLCEEMMVSDNRRGSDWYVSEQDAMKRLSETASAMRSSRVSVDSSSNIFRPSIRMMLRQSHVPSIIDLLHGQERLTIENFLLKKQLNHLETRNLERFAMPRIISSFKMPTDVLEAMPDVEGHKAKKGLVKRPENEATTVTKRPELKFDYAAQVDTPERVFPFFPYATPLKYIDRDEPQMIGEGTMQGLIQDLEDIKHKYVAKSIDLLIQPNEPEKKDKDKKNKDKDKEMEKEEIVLEKAPPESKSKKHTQAQRRTKSILSNASKFSLKELQEVNHWTEKYIKDTVFDPATNRLTFKTDRLGYIGLAFKRYEHFPFRDWSLQPNEENPDELILTVETMHVRIFFYISAKGVRGYVTDLYKGYTAKPVKYLNIEEPISDFRQLRKLFLSKNINIFAEQDASFYIDKGYFSMKHVATEHHTYNLMALHCKTMKFYRSSWNRLAERRDIIMGMKIAKDTSDYSEVTLRITPEKTTFVTITENCSDQVDVIVLTYQNTWRNIGNFTDLHQAITSMVLTATELRNKDSVLLYFVRRMLMQLRILSFA